MKNKIIVVLGMHRSGTSALVRGLKVIGVDLGNRFLPTVEGVNDKGFWEDQDIHDFNEEILAAIDSKWLSLTPISSSNLEYLQTHGFVSRATGILRNKSENSPLWGFKDPRVAKLLPFWKIVFDLGEFDVDFVIALRHPLSIAHSLMRRDRLEIEHSYILWLGSLIEILTGSEGRRRVIVDYDHLINSPDFEINRIASTLGLKVDKIALKTYATEFLEETLRHSKYELTDLTADDSCPPLVNEIYSQLIDIASDRLAIDDLVLQSKIKLWEREFGRINLVLKMADKTMTRYSRLLQSIAEPNRRVGNVALRENELKIKVQNQSFDNRIIPIASAQNAPTNLLRLSFPSQSDYSKYAKENENMLTQTWLWHQTLGDRSEPIQLPGICNICNCQTRFTAKPKKNVQKDRFEFLVDWWAETVCNCGLSNLDRAVLQVLFEFHKAGDSVYHVGHFSAFRKWLATRIGELTSSQYAEGMNFGVIRDGVRYEDLTNLSFNTGEFSSIICMEILEHIPDYKAAMREMARTLKPGGRVIISVPWLGRDTYDHFIRAELKADGTIQHFYPPEYHGDPAKGGGILSFRSFGWKILDELREAGFSSASAEFVFGPLHGYMILLTPVIVGIR